jgi:hypothetical protein
VLQKSWAVDLVRGLLRSTSNSILHLAEHCVVPLKKKIGDEFKSLTPWVGNAQYTHTAPNSQRQKSSCWTLCFLLHERYVETTTLSWYSRRTR